MQDKNIDYPNNNGIKDNRANTISATADHTSGRLLTLTPLTTPIMPPKVTNATVISPMIVGLSIIW